MGTTIPDLLPRLFLLTDSALPVGSFAQSYGLETYIADGIRDVEGLLSTYLEEALGRSDGPAMVLSYRAAARGDLTGLLELDELVGALRVPREWREAGAQVGRRLLRLGGDLWPGGPALSAYAASVAEGRAAGQHPVAAGVLYQAAALPVEWAAVSFLYSGLQGLVSAAVRLVPLGQTEGQRLLEKFRPRLAAAAERCLFVTSPDEFGAFLPGFEIRGMRHEKLYTRLFIS